MDWILADTKRCALYQWAIIKLKVCEKHLQGPSLGSEGLVFNPCTWTWIESWQMQQDVHFSIKLGHTISIGQSQVSIQVTWLISTNERPVFTWTARLSNTFLIRSLSSAAVAACTQKIICTGLKLNLLSDISTENDAVRERPLRLQFGWLPTSLYL